MSKRADVTCCICEGAGKSITEEFTSQDAFFSGEIVRRLHVKPTGAGVVGHQRQLLSASGLRDTCVSYFLPQEFDVLQFA
jgi:hypothetical protein